PAELPTQAAVQHAAFEQGKSLADLPQLIRAECPYQVGGEFRSQDTFGRRLRFINGRRQRAAYRLKRAKLTVRKRRAGGHMTMPGPQVQAQFACETPPAPTNNDGTV